MASPNLARSTGHTLRPAMDAVHPPAQDVSPPAALLDSLGWRTVRRQRLPFDGAGEFSLRTIAKRARTTAVLVETAASEPFPDWATRRLLYRQASVRPGPVLLVFTHPLHPSEVWQWTERSSNGLVLHAEHRLPSAGDREGLAVALARWNGSKLRRRARHSENPVGLVIADAVRRRAAQRLRGGAGEPVPESAKPGSHPMQRVIDTIEASEDPAVARAFWWALQRLAVLDPRCGSARLLDVLSALQPVYDACLRRMLGWLDDLDGVRQPHRPEKMADFRRILAGASDGRRHFVVRSILQNNLFGADPSARALRACERRLLDALHAAGDAEPPPPLNLRHGDVDLGFQSWGDVERVAASMPDARGALTSVRETAETIAGARRLLRRMADPHCGAVVTEAADEEQLQVRRAALRTCLNEWAAARHGISGDNPKAVKRWLTGARPVHLWAEFFEVSERGGFNVVLADGGHMTTPEPSADPPTHRSATSIHAAHVRERGPAYSAAAVTGDGSFPLHLLSPGSAEYPRTVTTLLGSDAPATLFVRGDANLLRQPLLALFCSVHVPASIILQTLDAARAFRDQGAAVAGGFQTPLERECLAFLLRGRAPVVLAPARGIHPMRLPAAWTEAMDSGRMLLVSRFEGRMRRPTSRMAELRNLLVGALAERCLIAHATPGGRTYRLARQLIQWEKPVYTWDDPHNTDLVRLGARPISSVAECLETHPISP